MEQEKTNPEDIISFDVPLFIRLLEFAREDATDDATLHKVTENVINLCQDGQVLSMDQYDQIVDTTPELDTSNMNSIHERKNNNKMNEIDLNRWAKLAGIVENEESSNPTVRKALETKMYTKITPDTDVQVGQLVLGYNGYFGEISKVNGDKYKIEYDDGDDVKVNRKDLEQKFLIRSSDINESILTIKSIKKVDAPKDAPSIVRNNYKSIEVTLSDGSVKKLTPGDLEGIMGGDSGNLKYYVGKTWDQ